MFKLAVGMLYYGLVSAVTGGEHNARTTVLLPDSSKDPLVLLFAATSVFCKSASVRKVERKRLVKAYCLATGSSKRFGKVFVRRDPTGAY